MNPRSIRKYQRIRKELQFGVLFLIGLNLIGTLWYTVIEGWKFHEAVYMTVITLATVGFQEVHPLGVRGRMFTISLIILGVIGLGYIINRFTDALIQGYFQDRFKYRQQIRLMRKISDHIILCGFGRTGGQIARELVEQNMPFIVVDAEAESIDIAQSMGYSVFQGDATLDDTLLDAGIERAACFIAALTSDADNLYAVLSAKTLNPNLRIIARASSEEAIQKLQRVGADVVVSPYITGGKRMAAAALRPQVMDFVDGMLSGASESVYIEELELHESDCPEVGKSLRESDLRSRTGAMVLAIRRLTGQLIAGPSPETQLEDCDTLICMGTAEQLRDLNQILSPLAPQEPRVPRSLRRSK
ncbi:potassium channel family protein [Lyngbya confervoides]|uniref:Potassium channel protein n=1 Tax=Lyngbya confervoides BDU141951 TaxID=1574623 RepID=A0ABD4SZ82_9CYAN|nr:potassium channel protein [Lyngbya confervoides]MCM1981678.1 potassium channel protein [Lyngbya confervoides BDU141951]